MKENNENTEDKKRKIKNKIKKKKRKTHTKKILKRKNLKLGYYSQRINNKEKEKRKFTRKMKRKTIHNTLTSNNDDSKIDKSDKNDENDKNNKRHTENEEKLRRQQKQQRQDMNVIDMDECPDDEESLIFKNHQKERKSSQKYQDKKNTLDKKIYIGRWGDKDINKQSLLLKKMYTNEYKKIKQKRNVENPLNKKKKTLTQIK